MHVAAHCLDVDACVLVRRAAQVDSAGHATSVDFAITAAFRIDVAGDRLELDLAVETPRADVAGYRFQMRAIGRTGEVDGAADAAEFDFLRGAVQAQLAADAVDFERAPRDAGQVHVGADHLDLQLRRFWYLDVEQRIAHARVRAPTEPALLVRRLHLDRQVVRAAFDDETLRAGAEGAADRDLGLVPGADRD